MTVVHRVPGTVNISGTAVEDKGNRDPEDSEDGGDEELSNDGVVEAGDRMGVMNTETSAPEFDDSDDPEEAIEGPAVRDVGGRAEGHYD